MNDRLIRIMNIMLRHAKSEQLTIIYSFIRGYLRTPLEVLEEEIESEGV